MTVPIPGIWAGNPGNRLLQALRAWGILSNGTGQSLEERVDLLEQLIVTLVPSATGQLYLEAASSAFPSIGGAWQTIDAYDATVPSDSGAARGVTLDLGTSSIALRNEGIWQIWFSFTMSHNESNQGRTVDLRLFNIDAATGNTPVTIAIGRNQPGTSATIFALLEVPQAAVGNRFRVEIRSDDSLTSVSFTEAAFGTLYADNLGNLQLPAGPAGGAGFSSGFSKGFEQPGS